MRCIGFALVMIGAGILSLSRHIARARTAPEAAPVQHRDRPSMRIDRLPGGHAEAWLLYADRVEVATWDPELLRFHDWPMGTTTLDQLEDAERHCAEWSRACGGWANA